jgi:SAM-dependent methyltransferase
MLSEEKVRDVVGELIRRPGHEGVRARVYQLLTDGLGAKGSEIAFERPVPEACGRIDALLGRTVFEFKSNLAAETKNAESELTRYLAARERESGQRYVGIATDGAEFIPYELRKGKLVRLRSFRPTHEHPRDVLVWLSSVVALEPQVEPEPRVVRAALGKESTVYEVARSRLQELWSGLKNDRDTQLKRDQWAARLRLVYGSFVDDDELFLQHTYLTIVAKTMATIVLDAGVPGPEDLLTGRPFQEAGISGVVEGDFFDWVLVPKEGQELVGRIATQVERFRLGNINHDVLKSLYESLIDPAQRHYLGEYYTPDWLAQWICESTIDKPLSLRVLDPACGSGTFLFQAVRRFLTAADGAGVPNAEAVKACTEHVFGIDVHPLAVINARVTYLLALGEERLRDRPPLSIPVYLGDSLQWYTQAVLFEQNVLIETRNGPALSFPYRVASEPATFDLVIAAMLDLADQGADTGEFKARLQREGIDDGRLLSTLANTFENFRKVRDELGNHIWGYIARNLSRPVWLSSPNQRVDVIFGNPPWLAYRDMDKAMQKRFRDECTRRGLWAGGKVATHQDLSAYFFARCVELYAGRKGKIAFVMPYATMTRQQYRDFRTGVFAQPTKSRRKAQGLAAVRFTSAWIFDESVQPLFNVPSCVLFADVTESGKSPAAAVSYSGELPRRDASSAEAEGALRKRTVPWPSGMEEDNESYYGPRFRQGATVVPRRLFVVTRAESGRFGSNPNIPLVQSREGKQDKTPWKNVSPLKRPVEKQFLRPLYLGESVAPFRLLEPAEAVIPWDSPLGLVDAAMARRRGYTNLARWMGQAEDIWETHRKSGMSLLERLDFQHELASQLPPARARVVYAASGTIPAAALLEDLVAIVEHALYWAEVGNNYEGRYLTAFLNSEALRVKVAPFQAKGQWGARHFDKLPLQFIPKFDPDDDQHRKLVELAVGAEDIAQQVQLPDNVGFVKARQMIRAALREAGTTIRIDSVVSDILQQAQTGR